jgi:hypothetical protein
VAQVHLPYVADENAEEDPEIKILVASEGPAFTKMREIMVSKGRKVRAVTGFLSIYALGGGYRLGLERAPLTRQANPVSAAGARQDQRVAGGAARGWSGWRWACTGTQGG